MTNKQKDKLFAIKRLLKTCEKATSELASEFREDKSFSLNDVAALNVASKKIKKLDRKLQRVLNRNI